MNTESRNVNPSIDPGVSSSPRHPSVSERAGAGADPGLINILIVDDEPANLVVLETILDDPGYRLVRALSADEALLALVRDEFALLMLDVRMPGMDGFELAQLIKQRKKTASVPIIFLTAYYDKDQHVLEGYGSGAVDFLSKPVNAAVLRSKVAVFADLHRKTRAIANANDALVAEVAERRRAEEDLRDLNQTLEDRVRERTDALRRADLQLREMMTSITDALFMVDRDWRITYANERAAALLHTEIHHLEQARLWDLPLDALGRRFRERAESAIALSKTVCFDEYFPDLGKWLQCHCYPSDRGLSVYFLDITDRMEVDQRREHLLAAEQAARAEAERVARAKDEFLASLSHELRTPLSAILGWTNVLQRKQLDAATVQRGIEVIARNAKTQAQLVSDLLDVGRVASGKLRVEFRMCDLNAVAVLAADTSRPAAQAKGVAIDVRLESALPTLVMGNEERLHQVVSNLVNNALKFTPAGGSVVVETAAIDGKVELRVIDNGEGISADFLPHLFERFSQADSSAARVHGGLGLGLSIVQNLVEIHGGRVLAVSDGLGRGSTFTVQLPTASNVAPEVMGPEGADDSRGAVRPKISGNPTDMDLAGVRVLIVDDHPDVLEVQRRMLVDGGATVELASSADEALARLHLGGIDVLLSDLGMPGMDGYSLIHTIRHELGLSAAELPAAAVTAYVRAEDRARAISSGYQFVLQKPASSFDLFQAVQLVRLGAASLSKDSDSTPLSPSPSSDGTGRRLSALFVEDNLDLQEQIGWLLEEEGVEFVVCGSGEEAMSLFSADRFDLVLADISLPGISGVDLAKGILQRHPDIWFVFSTGYAMEDELNKLGPHVRTLLKPFDLDQLHAVLDEIQRSIES